MLEVEFDLALEDDKQPGVAPLSKDLILDEVEDLLTWAVILSFEVVEASQLFEGVDIVLVDSKVSHALDGDASLLLDLCSEIKLQAAIIHDEADALLSLSEEGEPHHEVSRLSEAVKSQEVLVGALREEQRPTRI